MEQVIRGYGRFLLEAAAAAMSVWLLMAGITDGQGKQGIFSVLGTYVREEAVTEYRTDARSYQTEASKSVPIVTYVSAGILYTGSYELDSVISASDSEGEKLPVRVCSIRDPYGIERIGEYSSDMSQIQFPVCGIYTLRVSARDEGNRVSTCEFCIPVNSREGVY